MDLKCCVMQGSSAPFQISLLPCGYFSYLVFSLQRRSFCFVFSFLSRWWFSILKAVLLCQITLLYFQVSQKKEPTQKTQNRGSEVPWGCHGYWNCLGRCESERGAEKGPGSGGRGEEQRDGGRRWGQNTSVNNLSAAVYFCWNISRVFPSIKSLLTEICHHSQQQLIFPSL